MKDDIFPVRTYAKSELAHLYLPGICLRSALRTFSSWMKRNAELSESLQKYGYRERSKFLTPKQVELIVGFLGEP